ncbi:uncharacterized protein LOC136034053 [Artemia franciscana]|uniref:uncharacterized protein LOC136034053 n=1 Tax=Artemia franciscana TaxID=6661 RepID=UPI0032DAE9A2
MVQKADTFLCDYTSLQHEATCGRHSCQRAIEFIVQCDKDAQIPIEQKAKDYPCLLIMEVHTSIVCANEESDKGHVFEEVETDESGSSKSKLKMETIGQDAANDDISVIHVQVEDNTFDSTDEVINVTSSSDIERNRANCTPVDDNTSEYFPLSRYNSSSSIHEKVSEPQTGSGNVDNLVLWLKHVETNE